MRLLVIACVFAIAVSGRAAEQFKIVDKDEFAKIIGPDAKVEKLAGDMKSLEGPCWMSDDGGYLLFSDIPQSQIKKWSEKDGLTTFRDQSNGTNGNTRDAEGRLISCEHTSRRVTRTEKDGRITVLTDKFEGKRFHSPNDVVVKSDGTIWFTDPPYGIPKDQKKELDKNYVFRFDAKTKEIRAVVADCNMPNGLAFSPDEKVLYVADSGTPKHIRAFTVNTDGTLSGGDEFCKIDKGAPDGIRVDATGRVFSSAADGVQIFSSNGKLIGRILVPESPANLNFGGGDKKELYITARTSLYRIKLLAAGK